MSIKKTDRYRSVQRAEKAGLVSRPNPLKGIFYFFKQQTNLSQ